MSLVNIGAISGSLLGGYCGGRWGPRLTTLAACLPSALGWLTMALSPSLPVLLAGRVICGSCGLLAVPNSSLLVAQYSGPRHRDSVLHYYILVQLTPGLALIGQEVHSLAGASNIMP